MKRLHWTVLRALPLPFVGAFTTLMFLLLMQFLIRYLPELVGRGLPTTALVELMAYSLAYMVTLAVPMAWMIALLAAFGRLAESRAWAVVKSAGVSLVQLAWPALLVGAALTAGMLYFNHVMLPEANFRMSGLWRDIRLKRPGFELEPGVFYSGIRGYSIRAQAIPADSTGLLLGVTVFQTDAPGGGTATLVAARGRLATRYDGRLLELVLEDGELHRRAEERSATEDDAARYERLAFGRHRLLFDLSDLAFERRERGDDTRSDRTMPTSTMLALVDSLDANVEARTASLRASLSRLGAAPPPDPETPPDAAGLDASDSAGPSRPERFADVDFNVGFGAAAIPLDTTAADTLQAVTGLALQRARILRGEFDAAANEREWEQRRADRYRVEIYKKSSIALACVVFVLVGVPLGLAMARRGVGGVSTAAVGIFLFYWVTLVQGEKLADRGMLPPGLGMWAANVLIGLLGLYLTTREARDPAGRDFFRRLVGRFRRRPTPAEG